jgi:nitrilase
MANVVAIQMTSSPDVSENLKFVEQQLKGLQVSRPCLVVLPECFACFGGSDQAIFNIAEDKGAGPVQQHLSDLCKTYQVWMVAGSFPLLCDTPDKYTASSLLFDDKGQLIEEYQKIHMFDVQVNDNTGAYLESARTQAGSKLVVVNTPFGNIGMAVCYDLRFAAMFNAMAQIACLDLITLPAAFTQNTGQAHWRALVAARAIENQCYVVAANQLGVHTNQRQTYGHSCIISPWGETIAELTTSAGSVHASVDLQLIQDIRTNMPLGQHNKFRSYLV